MARSYLSFAQRWQKYRAIPEEKRDIFHLIWMLTGFY